jgi:tetratricopeptide (TPR) repeat protein
VAASLSNLAALHLAQGQYAQAEPLFKRSLAIHEKGIGPDHFPMAMCLEKVAEIYRATNREREAEEFAQRATRIRTIKR